MSSYLSLGDGLFVVDVGGEQQDCTAMIPFRRVMKADPDPEDAPAEQRKRASLYGLRPGGEPHP